MIIDKPHTRDDETTQLDRVPPWDWKGVFKPKKNFSRNMIIIHASPKQHSQCPS